MGQTGVISGLLRLRRARVVAEILGHCERQPWYVKLDALDKAQLRETVQGSVNAYHDVSLDLLRVATDDTVMINEQAVRMIADIHGRTG